jgi:hypothetical protein
VSLAPRRFPVARLDAQRALHRATVRITERPLAGSGPSHADSG